MGEALGNDRQDRTGNIRRVGGVLGGTRQDPAAVRYAAGMDLRGLRFGLQGHSQTPRDRHQGSGGHLDRGIRGA